MKTETLPSTPSPELSFDGCGINGPDEYRTRLATFNRGSVWTPEQISYYGKLFETAPELFAALVELEKVHSSPHSETQRYLAREAARAAIIKAETL